MGIDAEGYFVTKRALSDEEIGSIITALECTYYREFKVDFSSLRGQEGFTDRCVRIGFDLDRLYSKGYARGPFVKHATICGWLRRRPYVEAVYYGGDCNELVECCEWNEATERELFDLYLQSNQLTYRNRSEPLGDEALLREGGVLK